MKQNVLAIALTLALAAALGLALWWDARPVPTENRPLRDVPASAPLGSAPVPSSARGEQHFSAADGTTVRCEFDGRVSYQPAPCMAGARQTRIEGGTFTVVSPPRLAAAPSPAPDPVEHAQGGTVGFVARTPVKGNVNAARCERLKQRIAMIDEQARRGQSSSAQRHLQEARLNVRDEMWELKCGF